MTQQMLSSNKFSKLHCFRIIVWLGIIVLVAWISFGLGKREKDRNANVPEQYVQAQPHRRLAQEALKSIKLAATMHISLNDFATHFGVVETLDSSIRPNAPAGYTHVYYHPATEYEFFLRFTDAGLMDSALGERSTRPR